MSSQSNAVQVAAAASANRHIMHNPAETKATARRVRFHKKTKKYDGLRNTTRVFHEHMKDVLYMVERPGGKTVVSILVSKLNVLGLGILRNMLVNLILRCKRSTIGRAVVLNEGGSLESIFTADIPYLTSQVEYLDTVISKVRIDINKARAVAAAQNEP
jgi:hypothetical protein